MTLIILFLTVLFAIAGWWLAHQGLMTKPWLEEGHAGDFGHPSPLPKAKIGLGVFLAVASALFVLLISAYGMRMQGADWRPLPQTNLLWINTGVLVLSSAALHWTVLAARGNNLDGVRLGLLVGGASALVFIAGQLLAWRQLMAEGYFVASNPANSFFYLLTAVHGLHVVGGVAALVRTGAKAWQAPNTDRVRQSVELCAVYWHFLLVVWLVVFALLLLTGTYSEFYDWIYAVCFGGAS